MKARQLLRNKQDLGVNVNIQEQDGHDGLLELSPPVRRFEQNLGPLRQLTREEGGDRLDDVTHRLRQMLKLKVEKL